jgi:hypothetical protein
MEITMDDNQQNVTSKTETVTDVFLTTVAQQYLNQTRPWARFISILLFISSGLMFLGGLAMFLIGLMGGGGIAPGMPVPTVINMVVVGLVYFISAGFYIPPGIFLARYASSIRFLEENRSSKTLEDTLKHQKSFWRYVGIMTIIALIVTVLFLVFGILIAILAATASSK